MAFTFLKDGKVETDRYTFAELDRQARAIAVELARLGGRQGERALLLYPPGSEFMAAFMGALYAGIIAIPAPPPDAARLRRTLPRLRTIAQDAQASLVLATRDVIDLLTRDQDDLVDFPPMQWLASDQVAGESASAWQMPPLEKQGIAFLQYTSGSTSIPKGVVVTHHNIIHHSHLLQTAWKFTPDSVSITWVPYFHDLGLIGGLIQPLYNGNSCYILSPLTFLKRPLRWLEAIHRYRGTHSHGPNFAYELCVHKITPEQKATLDLSSWQFTGNGAEPVRKSTLDRFQEAFGPCGFRADAHYPIYGMAETTLIVSTKSHGDLPQALEADPVAMGTRQTVIDYDPATSQTTLPPVSIVSNGPPIGTVQVVIVDPDTLHALPENRVGEIWVQDAGVAQGYWQRPEESRATFHARLADAPERGDFLRTGDLGFLRNGELYPTSRLKNLIIIAGVNHYPQDVELTVQNVHPVFRPDHCVAFAVEIDETERLVIVVEVEYRLEDWEPLFAAVRQALSETHDLELYSLLFLKKGQILKTSSGKLQHSACRKAWLEHSFDVVASWQRHVPASPVIKSAIIAPASSTAGMPATSPAAPLPVTSTAGMPATLPTAPLPVTSTADLPATSPAAPVPVTSTAGMPAVTPATTTLSGSLPSAAPGSLPSAATSQPSRPAAPALEAWLLAQLAKLLDVPVTQVDRLAPFASYGLSSQGAVMLVGDLEAWLGEEGLAPTLLWDYPTIDLLTRHLCGAAPGTAPHAGIHSASSPAERGDPIAHNDPIAIVGLGLRFPGSDDPEQFWNLLHQGIDAIRVVPDDRWDAEHYFAREPVTPGKINSRFGGFLDQVDGFDAGFFGISPYEAQVMDPQQRLLLEVSWEALEQAGINPESLAGSATGVFIGICSDDYGQWLLQDERTISSYTGTGKAMSIAANRLSYQLDLRGPSVAIDTACSSSLVAIHQACQALRNGECDLALAGGVNLILTPHMSIAFSQAQMLAVDGRCKTFDAAANGYVRSEGCGVVVLKRLSHAQKNGDTVLALVLGSAINQDGRSNGLTAPNGLAQQAVIRQALAAAGVTPAQITLAEAHGTGTPLGDPIEMKALQAVLSAGRPAGQRCAIGAVKSNIGHLEGAAGIAGISKVVLSLHHAEIPPNLHLHTLNPLIELDATRFFLPTTPHPWNTHAGRRIAGVSSFGFGGTNAHVILAEPPPEPPATPVTPTGEASSSLAIRTGEAFSSLAVRTGEAFSSESERPWHLLTLSAKDGKALQALADRYRKLFTTESIPSLADLCFSANVGRAAFSERLVVTATTGAEMQAGLAAFTANQPGNWQSARVDGRQIPRVAWLFTGQGSQYAGMGEALYTTQPVFRAAFARCQAILEPLLGCSLPDLLWPGEGQYDGRLDQTAYTQPALFALEYALAEMWRAWGVTPTAVMGHSVGEYVAACIAGVFSLEDGLRLIAERGRLINSLPGNGSMVAVQTDVARVTAAIGSEAQVVIATMNGPNSQVIAGEKEAVARVATILQKQGVELRPLTVSHAFHSPLLDPILEPFARAARQVRFQPPRLPVISNLTGQAISDAMASADYWVAHVRQPVRFGDGMRSLLESGCDVFLEIGPQPTLLALGQRIAPAVPGPEGSAERLWLPSLRPKKMVWPQILSTLGQLVLRGVAIDWRGFDQGYRRQRIALPTYPFQRQRHWLATPPATPSRAAGTRPSAGGSHGQVTNNLLGRRVQSPLLRGMLFESSFNIERLPLLGEHRVFAHLVVPAAAQLSLLLAAARAGFGTSSCALEDIIFPQALVIPEQRGRRVQLLLEPPDAAQEQNGHRFRLLSQAEESDPDAEDRVPTFPGNTPQSWEEHASGRLRAGPVTPRLPETPLATVQARCPQQILAPFYTDIWQQSITLGPEFRWVESLWQGEGELLARLRPETPALAQNDPGLHAGLIDSMLQIITGLLSLTATEAVVPFSLEGFHYLGNPDRSQLWSHLLLRRDPATSPNDPMIVSDVRLLSAQGELVAEAVGFRVRRVESRLLLRDLTRGLDDPLYQVQWVNRPALATPGPDAAGIRVLDASGTRTWLIFTNGAGLIAAAGRQLRARGDRVVMVTPAAETSLQIVAEDHYRLDPAAPAALDDLFASVGGALQGILYGWGLELPALPTTAELVVQQRLVCGGLLHLVQALAGQAAPAPLWLVTCGGVAVQAGEPGHATQQMVWGMGRVIRTEHPAFSCRLIDLDPTVTPEQSGSDLLTLLATADAEPELAHRQGSTLVSRLATLTLPPLPPPAAMRTETFTAPVPTAASAAATTAASAAATTAASAAATTTQSAWPALLDDAATTLITGGLGGLGLALAEWLATQGVRHIALLGRRPPDAAASQRIAALRTRGTQVTTWQADCADHDQLATALAQLQATMPPLRGVFHAAGILDDGVLTGMTWERFARVLAPKCAGSWNLHLLTRNLPLAHFVGFSSVVSVLGLAGQGNYAAANAFMDGLMRQRRAEGLPGLGINWGAWHGIGMTAGLDAQQQERLQAMGMDPLSLEQGFSILGRLLGQTTGTGQTTSNGQTTSTGQTTNKGQTISNDQTGNDQMTGNVCVLPITWSRFLARFAAPPPFYRQLRQVMPATPSPAPGATTTAETHLASTWTNLPLPERWQHLENHVRREVAHALGMTDPQQLATRTRFFDLGLDSLGAVELRNRLASGLGCTLRATLLFDFPMVDVLVDHLGRDVLGWQKTTAPTEPDPDKKTVEPLVENLDSLSEQELADLLTRELSLS
ncbi:MAG: SDR family NAD(P)-dependent oxidoreductase [Magnetococcus sp. DMHC-1]